MNRISIVLIIGILLISLLGFSETIIFAQDVYTQNLPKYEGDVLIQNEENTEMMPCGQPVIECVVETKIMKDELYTLAFITDEGIKKISLDEYLIGVVMSELPYTFEAEAIKAQAVAARTYAIRELEIGARHGEGALCDDPSHCSAFITEKEYEDRYGSEAFEIAYQKVKDAVKQTDGEIITYGGEPCCAVYHSASDGYTENSYNLWGTETPYLKSVGSYEIAPTSEIEIKEADMTRMLSNYGTPKGCPDEVLVSHNDSGRCKTVTINGVSLKGKTARTIFGLKSCDFDLYYRNGIYTFCVRGYGHGIGLSQYGANEMAKAGKTYDQILLHYYSGVTLESI